MQFILEFILGIIIEGSFEASNSKKVPLPLRILFAAFLAVLYLAIFGVLLWFGIISKSVLVIALVSVVFVAVTVLLIREFKSRI